MRALKSGLLSSSILHRCIGAGIVAGSAFALAACSNPYAAPPPGSGVAPAAIEQPATAGGRTALAANPCAAVNPCAPASPCSPCAAAAACGPCAPAAGPWVVY
jgi:hypothetical protein